MLAAPALLFLFFLIQALAHSAFAGSAGTRTHALGIHGDIKYGPDFEHFAYADPDAPVGGELRLAVIGTFDSTNPFILKGVAARGVANLIYNRLCTKSFDEPLTEYGELAEWIECPANRSSVTFKIRDEARWHDGEPITAADVVFTFETLVARGTPFYRSFYADVEQVEALDEKRVKFSFSGAENRELPLIIGQLRILPEHFWRHRAFEQTTLEPPLGSGAYQIESIDPGRSITYRRVKDNWDEKLPVRRGLYNFDAIRYDYYRDETVAIEALKAGEYDFRAGAGPVEWATSYDIEAVESGRLVLEEIPHQLIRGMSGFVFNTRRSKFGDRRVRRALGHAFDFEWTNVTLFHKAFTRTRSYFENSELASSGLPEGLELSMLESYREQLPPELFTATYDPPSTDGSGSIRDNLRGARKMLAEAGWVIEDGHLTNAASGEVMVIEFLLSRSLHERIIGPMQQHLRRLGIQSRIRTVDTAQYWNRLREFDYDIIVGKWNQYQSPGNEQRNYWTSQAAQSPGSRNYAGIADPIVDDLVEQLIAAPDRQRQLATARALDRTLLWGHYVIPQWHSRTYRLAYWNKFGRPRTIPVNGLAFMRTWWMDPALVTDLKR
jgi:microcin C transport system substrate-binding protein